MKLLFFGTYTYKGGHNSVDRKLELESESRWLNVPKLLAHFPVVYSLLNSSQL